MWRRNPISVFDLSRFAKLKSDQAYADLLAINKRAAHRAMEAAGIRAGMRATTDLQTLAFHQPPSLAYRESMRSKDLKEALSDRDAAFGDYRTGDETAE